VLEQLLYGGEEIETKIMTLELYVRIREYLLVTKILDALENYLNKETRYVLESLQEELLNSIRYYLSKGGLEETGIIDLVILGWNKPMESQASISIENKQ